MRDGSPAQGMRCTILGQHQETRVRGGQQRPPRPARLRDSLILQVVTYRSSSSHLEGSVGLWPAGPAPACGISNLSLLLGVHRVVIKRISSSDNEDGSESHIAHDLCSRMRTYRHQGLLSFSEERLT